MRGACVLAWYSKYLAKEEFIRNPLNIIWWSNSCVRNILHPFTQTKRKHIWLMISPIAVSIRSQTHTDTIHEYSTNSARLKSTHEAHFYCHQHPNLVFAAITRYLCWSIMDFCLSRTKNVYEMKMCVGWLRADDVYHWLLFVQIDFGRLDTCPSSYFYRKSRDVHFQTHTHTHRTRESIGMRKMFEGNRGESIYMADAEYAWQMERERRQSTHEWSQ